MSATQDSVRHRISADLIEPRIHMDGLSRERYIDLFIVGGDQGGPAFIEVETSLNPDRAAALGLALLNAANRCRVINDYRDKIDGSAPHCPHCGQPTAGERVDANGLCIPCHIELDGP